MARSIHPVVTEAITKLGQDIRNARLRRRIPVAIMAEKAGIGRTTLYKLERGDPKIEMSSYAAVLLVLGQLDLKRLSDVVDPTHDILRGFPLPKRIRHSHKLGDPFPD